jgi:pSer/pThr/pTyr-binding forkhead associated (FHA) protein
MDDRTRLDEADASGLPHDFYPLRLQLQPSGLTIELDRPDMLAGRHTGVDIRLPLPDVSRRHCRFVFAHGRWQVLDLDSLNGVWINNQRVSQSFLATGDMLRIGSFHFSIELSRAPDIGQTSVIRSIFEAPPRRSFSSHQRRKAS